MSKKLQILVPHYNEPWKIVKPLLDSLALQKAIDFNDIGVIMVNDGNELVFDKDLLKNYPYDIEYYVNEHKGVSATRNACLDKATAEYVMFADCDDAMYHSCAIWFLFQEINHSHFDTLTSVFIEENKNPQTGEHIFIERGRLEQGGVDSTFVHGKCHRRLYLINNNIRWDDSLFIHEDSYFNILCQSLTDKAVYCPVPFYLWCWNDDSVCRRDPLYLQKTFKNMLASNTALVKQFLDRNREDKAVQFVTMMVMDSYFSLNKEEWLKESNKEYRDMTERCFKEYYEKFRYLYEKVDPMMKQQILAGMRNRFSQEGLGFEKITFDDWMKHIENL